MINLFLSPVSIQETHTTQQAEIVQVTRRKVLSNAQRKQSEKNRGQRYISLIAVSSVCLAPDPAKANPAGLVLGLKLRMCVSFCGIDAWVVTCYRSR